jgi:hypothetical protein|eukprot:COSAG01_NODE_6772_length_3505_cov_20.000294_4_plen_60_part_00
MACCTARPVDRNPRPWTVDNVDLSNLAAHVVTDGYHTLPIGQLLPAAKVTVCLLLRRYG